MAHCSTYDVILLKYSTFLYPISCRHVVFNLLRDMQQRSGAIHPQLSSLHVWLFLQLWTAGSQVYTSMIRLASSVSDAILRTTLSFFRGYNCLLLGQENMLLNRLYSVTHSYLSFLNSSIEISMPPSQVSST